MKRVLLSALALIALMPVKGVANAYDPRDPVTCPGGVCLPPPPPLEKADYDIKGWFQNVVNKPCGHLQYLIIGNQPFRIIEAQTSALFFTNEKEYNASEMPDHPGHWYRVAESNAPLLTHYRIALRPTDAPNVHVHVEDSTADWQIGPINLVKVPF
jgi:hypothetical protein